MFVLCSVWMSELIDLRAALVAVTTFVTNAAATFLAIRFDDFGL